MFATLNSLNKKILFLSFLASILFHACEFHFFQNQKLWIPQKENTFQAMEVKKTEKEEILKQTFSSFGTSYATNTLPSDSNQEKPPIQPQKSLLSLQNPKTEKELNICLPEIQSLISNIKIQGIKISLPQKFTNPSQMKFSSYLPKSQIPTPQVDDSQKKTKLTPQNIDFFTSITKENSPPESLETLKITKPSKKIIQNNFSSKKTLNSKTQIGKLPSLEELQCKSVSDLFETDLVFLELKKDNYLFALTLIPKSQISTPPLKQNLYFLIDRSNSIQKERLKATKDAVKKAIQELSSTDSFNILAFDQRVDKLAPVCLQATAENKNKASAFLDSIELGSFFSKKDLFNPLFLTLPIENAQQTTTAILFTDGENLEKSDQLHALVNQWTFLNQGKVNLYTLCMDTDNQVKNLHALSLYNKGKALAVPTLKSFKRKLLKLIKTIQHPVAKDITIKAIGLSGAIDTYPKSKTAPILYSNEPYTIVGSTSNLEDFILFIQGTLDGKWLHIKKQISFKDAKKAGSLLKSLWAQQKAFDLYNGYILESNTEKFVQMQELIKTYELPEIFEKF